MAVLLATKPLHSLPPSMIAPDFFPHTRSGVHLKRIKNNIWELLGLQLGSLIRDFNNSASTDQPFFFV